MSGNDVITQTVCTECDATPSERTEFCPHCGAEDPWEEEAKYEFDSNDLPIIFSHRISKDNYELWRDFCECYFGVYDLMGSDIANLPDDFPRLSDVHAELYFAITEDYEVVGPRLDRREIREDLKDDE